MQETRQHILEILKEMGQATVDDIVRELRKRRGKITAVTVRHHLNHLQRECLISTPQIKHRSTPGRPQHVYALTEKADEFFPNNYQRLASGLLEQIEANLPPDDVNVILEGVADGMASQAHVSDLPMNQRLVEVVNYLNENGYNADWEETEQGYVLYTRNCPYHHLVETTDSLCKMDMRLISNLLGVVPRLLSRISEGEVSCAYLIPSQSE